MTIKPSWPSNIPIKANGAVKCSNIIVDDAAERTGISSREHVCLSMYQLFAKTGVACAFMSLHVEYEPSKALQWVVLDGELA